MGRFWRWLLRVSFDRVYPDSKAFVDAVNSETWVGAQIDSGGHVLRDVKPIGEYEFISIRCVITDRRTSVKGSVCTKDIDYYNKSWTG